MKCSKCKKYTPYHAFATFKQRNGTMGRRGICKECRGARAKENFLHLQKWRKSYNLKNKDKRHAEHALRRKNVKSIVDKIKSDSPCTDCGRKFPPVAMDFDHIKGKNRSIAGLVSGAYKIELILEEIKLCELVCACCHRIRTDKRKQNHAPRKGKS